MRAVLLLTLSLVAAGPAHAASPTVGGDVQAGWIGTETRDRAGGVTDAMTLRARARAGLEYMPHERWTLAVRGAALLDTDQSGWMSFHLFPEPPSAAGLRPGQATLDRLSADYSSADGVWSGRAGRFQVNSALYGVVAKGLGRNDSPCFEVTWTDGLWLSRAGHAWATHVIVEHHPRRGPTTALRPPLGFDAQASRAGALFRIEATRPAGVIVQRVVEVVYLPRALQPGGPGNPLREDYLAASVRGAVEWPFGTRGSRFAIGAEAGYAPNTPRRTLMGTGSGDADGTAWQYAASVFDAWPGHDFGVAYGRVADGWLVSNDFRPNESVVEARWEWHAHPAWTIGLRARSREERRVPYSPLVPRRAVDADLRATFRF